MKKKTLRRKITVSDAGPLGTTTWWSKSPETLAREAAATTKQTNPKEAFGEAKMPLGLVPDTAIAEENLAFLEGALKYGQYNWRVSGVKASTYNRAMRRHLKKWWNGQDRDPLTRVRELASIRACCGILLDAEICGMLNDDRPPRADIEWHLANCAETAKHLKELFKDHSPPQYTEREHGLSRLKDELAEEALSIGVPSFLANYEDPKVVQTLVKPVTDKFAREQKAKRKRAAARRKKRNATSRAKLDSIVGTRTKPPAKRK